VSRPVDCQFTQAAGTGGRDPAIHAVTGGTKPLWLVDAEQAGLEKWFYGAGFARASIDGTVNLTIDKPYSPEGGEIDAANQTLYLVNAFV
jgi:hypothetical protein